MANESQVTFPIDEVVDFVVIGSGSAGGIIAKELATNGFKVVVLEQGKYRKAADFTHDELSVLALSELNGGNRMHQQTFRTDASEEAKLAQNLAAGYAVTVGGASVHFSGNFWRFREIDFNERSVHGSISGTNFADWPISYAEIEPYYTKVDWEIGVSGAPGPNDSFRSKPFPVPPMPIKSSGVLLERAAKKLGISSQVEPLAILSQPLNGRPGCISCGFCSFFGCEVGAKSSTLAAMIPLAEASGIKVTLEMPAAALDEEELPATAEHPAYEPPLAEASAVEAPLALPEATLGEEEPPATAERPASEPPLAAASAASPFADSDEPNADAIVEEVKRVLRDRRWDAPSRPFAGFDSPPGKF